MEKENSTTVMKNCTHRDQLNIPIPLLVADIVNWYAIVVLGTLVNMLAVWCVASCTKTRPAVKVLLLGIFLPVLLICLVTGPARAEIIRTVLACELNDKTFYVVTMVVYTIFSQVELICIAIVAVLRAMAVWSPQRHKVGSVRGTVALVAAVILYSVLTGLGMLGSLLYDWVTDQWTQRAIGATFIFLSTTLPILVTGTSYAAMMLAVCRNKRRLKACQQQGRDGGVVNQATRAMFAVFVSNLVFGLPHGVFHLFDDTSHSTFLLVHLFFYPHFIVDPVVFIWFNRNHRERVRKGMKWLKKGCLFCPSSTSTSSALHLRSTPTSSAVTGQPSDDLEQGSPEKSQTGQVL